MSSIDKLLIRGIRSFDPQSPNVIEFYSPLTIIVGHNGSGKTTIIECLKYATTGDLPPNSKQGAFVHDPKIAHESEVKAQVKLKFKNVSGKVMVCTRSIQVTQKAKQVQQKTLESVLETKDPISGERVSLSTRCADLDLEMPIHLGVSKAILDNVIFCHQEESNWPLSEPGTLKKKFDDIFASTRYTKALENLKLLKKEMDIELKTENGWLKQKEDRKLRAEQLNVQNVSTEKRIQSHTQNIDLLTNQLEKVAEEISQLMKHVSYGENLNNKLASACETKKHLLSYMEDLRRNMVEILSNQSDEELRAVLEEFKENLATQQQDHERIFQERNAHQSRTAQLKGILSHKLTEKGKLDSEVQQLKHLRGEVANQKRSLFELLHLAGADTLPSESVMETIHTRLLKAQEHQEAVKSKCESTESVLYSQLNEASRALATLEAQKVSWEATLSSNAKKISDLTGVLSQLAQEESEGVEASEKLAALRIKIREWEDKLSKAQHEDKTSSLKLRLDQLDLHTKKLNDELGTISTGSEKRARLESREDDLARKSKALSFAAEKAINAIKEHNLQGVSKTTTDILADNEKRSRDLLESMKSTLASKRDNLKVHSLAVGDLQNQLNVINAQCNFQISEKKRLKDLIHQKERELQMAVGSIDVEAKLMTIDSELESLKKNLKAQQSMRFIMARFQGFSEQSHQCALCKRGLDAETLNVVNNTVNDAIGKIPAKLEELESKISNLVSQRNNLEGSRPLLLEIQQYNKALEVLEDHDTLSIEKESLHEKIDCNISTVACLTSDIEVFERILPLVQEWNRMAADYQCLEEECSLLRSEMSFAPSRSVLDIQQSLQKLHEEREITSEALELEHSRILSLQQELSSVQSSATHYQRIVSNKQESISKRDRIHDSCAEIQQETKSTEAKLKLCTADLARSQANSISLQAELHNLKNENEKIIGVETERVQKIKLLSDRLGSLLKELERVSTKNPEEQLYTIESEIQSAQNELAELEAFISELDIQNQASKCSI
jgi:DNA repair protein RAD50